MGAIAEAIVAYAQPLFDQTDGDIDKMNSATAIAQTCWNLALMPEDQWETAIDGLQPALNMTDEQFAEFRLHIVLPMIRRHYEMFPGMHGRSKKTTGMVGGVPLPTKKYPRTGRNEPCPCGSGRKFKVCCGSPK